MPEIHMPRLSDSMEEGVILVWLVADGEAVAEGDEIVEVETDKTNVAFEAEVSGVLRHAAQPGDAIAVGAPIGIIEEPGQEAAPSLAAEPSESEPQFDGPSVTVAPAVANPEPPPAELASQTDSRRRSGASPTATRLAQGLGIPIAELVGSGHGGRVLRSDVIARHESAPRPSRTDSTVVTPDDAPSLRQSVDDVSPIAGDREGQRVPLTRVQRLVAERMVTSKSTAPEFSATREFDLDAVHRLRSDLKARHEAVPSYNAVILAAVARTLVDYPLLTAHFDDGDIIYTRKVNLALAVATDAVLQAPVIHNAEQRNLAGITEEAERLTTPRPARPPGHR